MIETIIQAWSANPTLFSLSILSIVATILLVVVVAKKSINIKWGDKTFNIGAKDDPNKCRDCKLKVEEITKQRVKTVIKMRSDLVFRQTKYAQNAMEKVSHKMLEEYAIFLKAYVPDDVKSDWAYVLYRFKVGLFIEHRLVKGLIQVYNENHIAEKSELEWINHRNHVIETIHLDLLKFIDEEYYACHGMKREDLIAWHEVRWSCIADVVRDCLDQARIMSLKTSEEIAIIKKQHKIVENY